MTVYLVEFFPDRCTSDWSDAFTRARRRIEERTGVVVQRYYPDAPANEAQGSDPLLTVVVVCTLHLKDPNNLTIINKALEAQTMRLPPASLGIAVVGNDAPKAASRLQRDLELPLTRDQWIEGTPKQQLVDLIAEWITRAADSATPNLLESTEAVLHREMPTTDREATQATAEFKVFGGRWL